MIKITPEELVRYLYHETSDQKSAKIKAALQSDWNLRDTYDKLLNAHGKLNEIKVSPRKEAINKILEYAAKKQEQVTTRWSFRFITYFHPAPKGGIFFMTKKERYQFVINYFVLNSPDAKTELLYDTPYQLLVAVILSAQCTDKRVNLTTPLVFETNPDIESLSKATINDLFPLVKSI
jgi:hypothetical protein